MLAAGTMPKYESGARSSDVASKLLAGCKASKAKELGPTWFALRTRATKQFGRLGSGCATEFMRRTEQFVRPHVKSIRIDTHPDNIPMQGLIRKMGFTYCGDVTIESRRLAFEKPFYK